MKVAPTSFKDLLKPTYKHQVAINGNPTEASAAFSAVYAAALANGGSFGNIEPGIEYFKKLHQDGNFVPVTAGPDDGAERQTPIVIWWDYLLASEIQLGGDQSFKVVIPTRRQLRRLLRPGDQQDRAGPGGGPAVGGVPVLGHRPEPVAAGQGPARSSCPRWSANGTVDKTALRGPAAGARPARSTFPTQAQETAAEAVVAQQWPSVIG